MMMVEFFILLLVAGICLYLFSISATFFVEYQIRKIDKQFDKLMNELLKKKK